MKSTKLIGILLIVVLIVNITYALNYYGLMGNDVDDLILVQAKGNKIPQQKLESELNQYLVENVVSSEIQIEAGITFCSQDVLDQKILVPIIPSKNGQSYSEEKCKVVEGILTIRTLETRSLCNNKSERCY